MVLCSGVWIIVTIVSSKLQTKLEHFRTRVETGPHINSLDSSGWLFVTLKLFHLIYVTAAVYKRFLEVI